MADSQQQQQQQQQQPEGEDQAGSLPSPSPTSARSPVAQLTHGVNTALATINPLAEKVNHAATSGFFRVKQFAEEQIGTAEKTELSDYYRSLEQRVDRIKIMHENLIKVTTQFISPGTFTGIKLQFAEVMTNVAQAVSVPSENAVIDKLKAVNLDTQSTGQILGHHFTKCGQLVGTDTPIGSALAKCGEVQEKLGRARLQMNLDIYEKFVKTFQKSLETNMRVALHNRKVVQNARSQLDTLKARARSTVKPEKAAKIQDELDQAQHTFDAAVEASVASMKAVVTSTEPLASLADFMASLLAYYQRGFELLSELAPEIDAIKVAQESLSAEERARA